MWFFFSLSLLHLLVLHPHKSFGDGKTASHQDLIRMHCKEHAQSFMRHCNFENSWWFLVVCIISWKMGILWQQRKGKGERPGKNTICFSYCSLEFGLFFHFVLNKSLNMWYILQQGSNGIHTDKILKNCSINLWF